MKILTKPNTLTKKIISLFFSCAVFVGSIAPVLFLQSKETLAGGWPTIDAAANSVLAQMRAVQASDMPIQEKMLELMALSLELDMDRAGVDKISWAETLLHYAKAYLLDFEMHWKEWVLDTIAWVLAKVVIRSLTYSLVNWINSGFEGEPMFILDRTVLFALIIDRNVALILATVANFEQMPDILKSILVRGIINGIYTPFHDRLTPTFPGGKDGYAAYLRDPRQCRSTNSWECYISLSSPENNPFGLIRTVAAQLQRIITDKVADVTNDIIEGSGFMTFTECAEHYTVDDDPQLPHASPILTPIINPITGLPEETLPHSTVPPEGYKPACKRQQRVTPGKAAANELDHALGSTWASMVVADEIGESIDAILGALLNQFMQKGLLLLTKGVGAESFGSLGAVITPNSYLGASEDGYCNPDFISIDPDCDEDEYQLWCYDYKTGPTAKSKKECRGTEEACNAKREDFIDWCFTYKVLSDPEGNIIEKCSPTEPICDGLENTFEEERLPPEEGEDEGELKNRIVTSCAPKNNTTTIIENLEIGCTEQDISRFSAPPSAGDWCTLYSPSLGSPQQKLCRITEDLCEESREEIADKGGTALECEQIVLRGGNPWCFNYKDDQQVKKNSCRDNEDDCKKERIAIGNAGYSVLDQCSRGARATTRFCFEYQAPEIPPQLFCRDTMQGCLDSQDAIDNRTTYPITKPCSEVDNDPIGTQPGPTTEWCFTSTVTIDPDGSGGSGNGVNLPPTSVSTTACSGTQEACNNARITLENSGTTGLQTPIPACFERTRTTP